MANKFITLLRNDSRITVNFVLILIVAFVFAYLKITDNNQAKMLRQLETQKELIQRIPEMRNKLASFSQGITLNGIIFNQERPVAVINNTLVKEGDSVAGGVKIIAIRKASVILNDGSKDFELKLRE